MADSTTDGYHIRTLPPVADPAPLGLAAFALTTFLLSAENAKLTDGMLAWLGFAFAYGGAIQLLAGMWEFRNRNVFGATAFSTYGGFWIGLAIFVQFVAKNAGGGSAVDSDLGWILLAFAIFNTYMMLWATAVTPAVFAVFLTLEATEIILVIGFWTANATTIKIGGYVGIATAAVAWYTSAAGIINGIAGRHVVPVGKAWWTPAEARPGSPMPRADVPVR